MNSSKERFIYIFLLIFMCLASFGLGVYVFKSENHLEARPLPQSDSIVLKAKPIIPQDNVVTKNYVGFVEAINQVQIIPYINGYLQNIAINAGQNVQKGDLLFTINPDEYRAKLNIAKAAVLQAQADFEYNQTYYNRVLKSGPKAFSETEIDSAKNNFLQSQANLENAKASLELAQVNLNYTVVKAPISGLIGNFTLSPGDYVSPSSGALLNIVQMSPVRIVFSLTDTEYLDLKENNPPLFQDCSIRLILSNGTAFEYSGDFKYTDNQIDKSTNSLAVYTYFRNDNYQLFPNSYVTIEVNRQFKNTVLISKELVQLLPNGNFITIARNNVPQHIPVQILADTGENYIIKNVFQSGDLLLLENLPNLSKGTLVHFNIIS